MVRRWMCGNIYEVVRFAKYEHDLYSFYSIYTGDFVPSRPVGRIRPDEHTSRQVGWREKNLPLDIACDNWSHRYFSRDTRPHYWRR